MKKKPKYKTRLKGYCSCGWRFPRDVEVWTFSHERTPVGQMIVLVCPECGSRWEQSDEGVASELIRQATEAKA